jgi:hypothetical protein
VDGARIRKCKHGVTFEALDLLRRRMCMQRPRVRKRANRAPLDELAKSPLNALSFMVVIGVDINTEFMDGLFMQTN